MKRGPILEVEFQNRSSLHHFRNPKDDAGRPEVFSLKRIGLFSVFQCTSERALRSRRCYFLQTSNGHWLFTNPFRKLQNKSHNSKSESLQSKLKPESKAPSPVSHAVPKNRQCSWGFYQFGESVLQLWGSRVPASPASHTKLANIGRTTPSFRTPPALQTCSNLSRMPKLYAAPFWGNTIQMRDFLKML